jgi:queuine tRNA-ribosyltransferase
MFDCVLPTRNARKGTLFTWEGVVRIKNSRHRDDESPLDVNCRCQVCRRYSRGYLRHLYVSGEILASILNTYHNLFFYFDLMNEIRNSISNGSLSQLTDRLLKNYAAAGKE